MLDKRRKLGRQKELLDEDLVARDDFDTAQAALDAALAAQTAAEAQVESALAGYRADQEHLTQAQAALQSSRLNLQHTIITSPIAGTVISRNVDKGQTVAASFSSPTLFQIGEDLARMQVKTSIDESDVGKIKTGMKATFTVDAYPGEVFSAVISQIRLAATTVQNVITYDAILDVANPELKLKPGMTANVKIILARAQDVLRLSNTALRFKPAVPSQGARTAIPAAGSMAAAGNERKMPAPEAGKSTVWILDENKVLRPVVLRLGLTDGIYSQVTEGNLKEGDTVVTGIEGESKSPAANATSRAPGLGMPPMGPRP